MCGRPRQTWRKSRAGSMNGWRWPRANSRGQNWPAILAACRRIARRRWPGSIRGICSALMMGRRTKHVKWPPLPARVIGWRNSGTTGARGRKRAWTRWRIGPKIGRRIKRTGRRSGPTNLTCRQWSSRACRASLPWRRKCRAATAVPRGWGGIGGRRAIAPGQCPPRQPPCPPPVRRRIQSSSSIAPGGRASARRYAASQPAPSVRAPFEWTPTRCPGSTAWATT